jgi:hypothetical protein
MATPHITQGAQTFVEVFTPTRIMELLTALFDSLPAETRARLRWTPAEVEQWTLRLLDGPLDDALLLSAYQGVLRAGHEIYEGVFLKGGGLALLAWLVSTARKTGQLEAFLHQMSDQATQSHPSEPPVISLPTVQVRGVLASMDALSAYGYEWCVYALSDLTHGVFQSLNHHLPRWMWSLMSLDASGGEDEGEDEGDGDGADDEAAGMFAQLPPITRLCVAVGVSFAGIEALQLGAQAQRQPLELVRLVGEIERLLVSVSDALAQTRAGLDSDDDADTAALRALLDALSVTWAPLIEAHARLAQASDLVRTFKHRAALAVLDDASRAQDPSGVLERLYLHLSRGVSMMVYRPNIRPRSARAVQAAMREWSKTRSLWAAIGDEGLIDQDDDLKALKQRLQGREGTFTLMSMGRPVDAP